MRGRLAIVSALLLALLPVSACGEPAHVQATADGQGQEAVAQVGGATITLAEVDQKALMLEAGMFGGLKLGQALYEARKRVLDDMIAERVIELVATERGISRDEVIQQEIQSKVPPVTPAEIEAWYGQNQDRVRGAPLEQVREAIRQFLQQQRQEEAVQAFVARMRAEIPITLSLEPPRVEVAAAQTDPSTGPLDAPVQIIEFSDFQ